MNAFTRSDGQQSIRMRNAQTEDEQLDTGVAAALALTQAAKEKLGLIVARVEALTEEKKAVADQIKDVYGEAKAMGYDVKALRNAVRIRAMDRQKREEQEAINDLYLLALEMQD